MADHKSKTCEQDRQWINIDEGCELWDGCAKDQAVEVRRHLTGRRA